MRPVSVLATFACLFTAVATPCAAETPATGGDEAFPKQVFGKALDGNEMRACFKRVYSADHMKKHPQQNVRTMTLLVTGMLASDGFPQYGLALGVTFREDKRNFESWGSCGYLRDAEGRPVSPSSVHCGVDCDGGFLGVAVKDANSLVVTIPDGVRTWEAGLEDEEAGGEESSRFGSDDRVFRLTRTSPADCAGMWGDDTTALQDAE